MGALLSGERCYSVAELFELRCLFIMGGRGALLRALFRVTMCQVIKNRLLPVWSGRVHRFFSESLVESEIDHGYLCSGSW